MTALFDRVGDRFLGYYDSVQGAVRGEVIRRNLDPYVADARSALDVGCGEGLDAIWLARQGLYVTAIDPSRKMLDAARDAISLLPPEIRLRIRLLECDLRQARQLLHGQRFDLVACHGVMMYQSHDSRFVRYLSEVLEDDGKLSLVVKNGDALAYRAAASGQLTDARRLITDRQTSVGRLGVATKAHRLSSLVMTLGDHGLAIEDWFGVKVFSDTMTGPIEPGAMHDLIELEIVASRADPYRASGRLIHALARRKA
jgi:2-polyprenyl-3-methyl-5-hydroxy-6-metoxy-1,4-benzoquinol methylase